MENLLTSMGLPMTNPWVAGLFQSAIILVVLLILFLYGTPLLFGAIKKVFRIAPGARDEALILLLQKTLRRVLALIALQLIVTSFPVPFRLSLWIESITFIVVALLIANAVFEFTDLISPRLLKGASKEFRPLFARVIKLVVGMIILMGIMRHFNYDIWHLVTALGIGSLAIGLAAQPTLSNMIAGFTILIDRPFLPGDRVLLSGGDGGEVIQIGMRSTQIATADGNLLMVPNSELVTTRVINYNMPDNRLSQKLKLNFNLDENLDSLKSILKRAAENTPNISKDSVKVQCTHISDWALELAIHYNVTNYSDTSEVTDQLISGVLKALKSENITLALNLKIPRQESVLG